jgi:hypothetical protein
MHRRVLFLSLLTAVVPTAAEAHFILMQPPSWQMQGQVGDPQKMGPCGDPGTKTNVVTTFHAGDTVHFVFSEAIPHTGHYRFALGVHGMADLPADPHVTTNAQGFSVSVPIENPAQFPVLADGVNQHDGNIPVGKMWTADVKLPADMTCQECVLQITEYMRDHGSNTGGNDGFFYHHCAVVNIVAAAAPTDAARAADAGEAIDAGTLDARGTAGTGGSGTGAGGSGGTGGTGGAAGTDGSGERGTDGSVGGNGTGGSAGSGPGNMAGTSGSPSGGQGTGGSSPSGSSKGKGGCTVGGATTSAAAPSALLALALGAACRRRHRHR